MTAPVQQKIWTITANQRIPILTYTTLVQQGGRYLRLIADTLLANGYTCKGSSNGTAAAMDGVNRWATDADASDQGANTTTAVSWMVLTDGNGADICMSYVGATGDVARIAFSPGGLYVVAGTPTFTPTATDECVLCNGVSLVSTSLVNDRVLYVWTDSEAKMMRVCCFVAGALCNGNWGVELLNANRNTLPFSPAVWGFQFTAANLQLGSSSLFGAYSVNSIGGQCRINGVTCNVFLGAEAYGGGSFTTFAGPTVKPELQHSIGYAMFPIECGTTTTNRQGPIGSLYDWWTGQLGASNTVGNVCFPGGQWMMMGISSGPVWPWDPTVIPQIS